MSIIYRPNGDTDLLNAVVVEQGTLPQEVADLMAGSYQVGKITWQADPVLVTAAAPSGLFATKIANDANLTGPGLAEGTEAITVVIDADFNEDTNGSIVVAEYLSNTFKIGYDSRSAYRRFNFSAGSQTSGSEFTSAAGNAITSDVQSGSDGRRTYVFAVTLNKGGMAELAMWINGVLVSTSTIAPLNAYFPTIRTFRAFNNASLTGEIYGLQVYAGSHAQGYPGAGGDVTGLNLIHSLSGEAANWNAPATGLVKAGTGLFM